MIHRTVAASGILLLAFSIQSPAADFSDPTWPCVQRKVESLSIGLMWPRLIENTVPASPETKAAISELSERLTLRRIALEDLRPDVASFADAVAGDAEALGHVFEGVFDTLATRRSRIIEGIGEFSLGQIALAEKIDNMRVEMDAELAKDAPDFDKVDALEEQLDWDQVIYTDRQQSITYLCETPVLLEKRLFAISQLLQNEIRSE